MSAKDVLLTGAGFILLIIGMIGIFVPIWPTTPFVLLAIACFSRNPKIRERLLQNEFIHDHYYNYKERNGLSKKNVTFSLLFLWSVLLISIYFTDTIWIMVLLACIGTAVTIHILCMAKPKKQIKEQQMM